MTVFGHKGCAASAGLLVAVLSAACHGSRGRDLIVVTLEQIMPYEWDTEFGIKKLIYDATQK